jgi:antitoxin FitA
MAQILVRNLDESVVDRLKKRATLNSRSLQSEVKLILEQASRLDAASAGLVADRIRQQFADRSFSDSADLIREDRDR